MSASPSSSTPRTVLTLMPRLLARGLRDGPLVDTASLALGVVDSVTRVTGHVLQHQAKVGRTVLGAGLNVQRVVAQETKATLRDVLEELRVLGGLVQDEASDVEERAREDLANARVQARRRARERRAEIHARFDDMSKAELHDQAVKRDLLRSGTAEELRERLVDFEIRMAGLAD